jgi:hypothetical protein
MASNLNLEAKLVEEARRAGRHKTKKDAVSAALAEYVGRRKQLRILHAFGTVEFDPKYNYKTERQARSQEPEAKPNPNLLNHLHPSNALSHR